MQIASMHFKARAGAKLADVKLQAALRKLQGNFVKGRADRMAEHHSAFAKQCARRV